MEWWKLFSGTFILIFLAELGDKTQLAAMAKTADSPDGSMAKWVVFFGASLALVTSTFIAVFLGHLLKAVVPDERYIKIAAAGLFLLFGFMILVETVGSFRAGTNQQPQPAAVGHENEGQGLVAGLALRAAMDFESLSVDRYRKLAAMAEPDVASILLEIAADEERHLNRLRGLPEQDRQDSAWNTDLQGRATGSERSLTADTLGRLIEQEESSAAFYRELAGKALIPSVRAVLTRLADEEIGHATRLRECKLPAPWH